MTLEWRGRTLVITWLPVASMNRLAACAPQTAAETEVLAALARIEAKQDATDTKVQTVVDKLTAAGAAMM